MKRLVDNPRVINNELEADAAGLTLRGSGGPLTVNGGIILSNGGGATLTLEGANPITVAGVISGAGGSVVMNGTETFELSGVNTYTGITQINTGTLRVTGQIAGNAAIGLNGALDVVGAVRGSVTVNGGTLLIGTDEETALPSRITFTEGNIAASGGPRMVANDLDIRGDFGVSGDQDITLATDIDLAADRIITISNTAATVLDGVISGDVVGLIKEGDGSLELRGVNTFNGPVTHNGGLLILGSDQALGTGSLIAMNGGSLAASGDDRSMPADMMLRINADFTVSGDRGFTIPGELDLTGNRTIEVTNTGGTVISGAIGGADFGLTKTGDQSLELSATNTYTGPTRVEAGTLLLSGSVAGDVEVAGGALNLTGLAAGNAMVTGGTLSLPGSISGDAMVTGGSMLLTGLVTGDAVVTGGTMELGSDNSVGGGLTLSGGTLAFGVNNAVDGVITVSGGTLRASGATRTVEDAIIVDGDFEIGGDQNLTLSGNVELTDIRAVTVTNSGATVFSGVLSGEGGLTKAGDELLPSSLISTLELSGVNTYTGLTRVEAGTLLLSGSVVGDVEVAGGTLALNANNAVGGGVTLSDGVLSLGGDDAVSGPITISGGTILASGASRTIASAMVFDGDFEIGGNEDLTLNGNVELTDIRAVTVTNSGATVISGVLSGAGGLTKAGNELLPSSLSSILELTGDNTYTGLTRVEAGTLLLNGSVAGDVEVDAATLNGNGTIQGDVTVLGDLENNLRGQISAGPLGEVGQMAINGDLTFDDASLMVVEITGMMSAEDEVIPVPDVIDVTGSVHLDGALLLRPDSNYQPMEGDSFTIITVGGETTDAFDDLFLDFPEFFRCRRDHDR